MPEWEDVRENTGRPEKRGRQEDGGSEDGIRDMPRVIRRILPERSSSQQTGMANGPEVCRRGMLR